MSLATLTLRLYREAALEALSGLGRSAWAVAMLMGMWTAMLAAALILGPTGLLGGFILFLIEAFLLGTYLSLVAVCVQGQRRIRPGDLREHAGTLFSECTMVMFFRALWTSRRRFRLWLGCWWTTRRILRTSSSITET